MTKTQAYELFGGKENLRAATELTRQAIDLWPEKLKMWHVDYLYGLANRFGLGAEVKKIVGY